MVAPNKKPVIIANWKMNLGLQESIDLARGVVEYVQEKDVAGTVILCPIYTALLGVHSVIQPVRKNIHLGAQDISHAAKGAHTGDISAWMAQEVGVDFVIIGHSERRIHLGETDALIRQKLEHAFAEGLTPILCVGETFDQRKEGDTDVVLLQQLQHVFTGMRVPEHQSLIVAYEPVWAISPSRAVEPEEAGYRCGVIRQFLIDLFPAEFVQNRVSIVYGGSVDQTNVASFVHQPSVHGCLIGNASTKQDSLCAIFEEVSNL